MFVKDDLHIFLCLWIPDGSLTRSLHHQPSSACPHSHGNPQLTPQPPPQGEFLIPHTFHTSLPSHPSGHAVPPAPPPPLSTHHLSTSSAPLAQHLPTDHQTLSHHMPALGPSVQRLHQHEMLQRMEVQRRRMMQHPTYVLHDANWVAEFVDFSLRNVSFFFFFLMQASTRASASPPSQNAPQLRPRTPYPCATNYVFPSSPAWAEDSMVSISRNEAGQLVGFNLNYAPASYLVLSIFNVTEILSFLHVIHSFNKASVYVIMTLHCLSTGSSALRLEYLWHRTLQGTCTPTCPTTTLPRDCTTSPSPL